MAQTALEAGFSMPAEWQPHERCWMVWPYREDLWADLAATQAAYVRVARAIARFEPLSMLAPPDLTGSAAAALGAGISVVPMPVDDSWARDTGPIFLRRGAELAGCSFRFNAWGGKHAPFDQDDKLAANLLSQLGLRCFESPLFLEGGALVVDGEGSVLASPQCVLNANRNPGLTLEAADTALREALGVEKVIWLPGDPEDVETDGHVDALACFVRPGVVLAAQVDDPQHPRHAILAENLDALRQATDARGRSLEIIELPEALEADFTSDVFCASYINFYIANGAIIMANYGIAADERAAQVLGRCFPDREIVGVDVTDIAPGGGGIHCITQQQPGVLSD